MSTLSLLGGLSSEAEFVGNFKKLVFTDITLSLVYISMGVILGFISLIIKNKQSES